MGNVSHDFVSVDMRGMKAALVALAQAGGVGVSTIVRTAVARELGREAPIDSLEPIAGLMTAKTVKVAVRMTSDEAVRLAAAAREAGLSRGAYIAGLVGGVAVLAGRADHVAALTASCAELAILSRNVHHLTTLLRQATGQAAQRYRDMLDTLVDEVHRHLKIAADALADMRPKRAVSSVSRPNAKGK
ncbi:MAG: hypothetical protein M3Y55_11060 [Pseudomonadota bacterium]|nr:hypothetical protein [Pseudomonadota bacterium]